MYDENTRCSKHIFFIYVVTRQTPRTTNNDTIFSYATLVRSDVVVDGPKLVENLSGEAALGARSVESLIHLIATVSPGAKLGSTAPYAAAELVMVEAGGRQPRSLANAFMRPVPDKDLQEQAVAAMSDYLARFDAMYEEIGRANV